MRRVLLALLLLVALGITPSAGADQSYTDPSGDGGPGTDITNVTVRNDVNTGMITIQLGSASPIVANHAIAVFIDADRNQATGDQGDEYWMFGGPLVGAAFFAWNGSDWIEPNAATFSARAAASNVTEFLFNKADIGNVSGFNFASASISLDVSGGSLAINFWDAAPDRGYWSYDLATPPPPPAPPAPAPAAVKPVIGAPVATMAVAGKPMTVTFPVTRSDNGAPLLKGAMTCDPSVSGKALAHRESFAAGKAKLVFTVPKTAKGKLLKVKLTISSSGLAATKVATFKVR
jgi:hypothetical protein